MSRDIAFRDGKGRISWSRLHSSRLSPYFDASSIDMDHARLIVAKFYLLHPTFYGRGNFNEDAALLLRKNIAYSKELNGSFSNEVRNAKPTLVMKRYELRLRDHINGLSYFIRSASSRLLEVNRVRYNSNHERWFAASFSQNYLLREIIAPAVIVIKTKSFNY